jgi:hypothetical protein
MQVNLVLQASLGDTDSTLGRLPRQAARRLSGSGGIVTDERVKPTAPASSGSSKDAEDNRVMAAIGYLGILFLVPLLVKKDSPFAQFHAKQGLALFVFAVIISMPARFHLSAGF